MSRSTSNLRSQNVDPLNTSANRRVAYWLFVMCALTALMVIVGGATRLTDSGLSITEWRPVTGAVPPLSEAAWLTEFEKYKQIPEYQEVNWGMSLAEFKEIYWWEWGHRFLGRLIGLAFALPFLYFVLTKQTSRSLTVKLLGLFVLGGAQGALGWYMVKSGLSDRIDVSQYRLAAHLALAVLLFALMFWLALHLIRPVAKDGKHSNLFWGVVAISLGVYAQIILGAFVAGLRAGRTFNTWPLMDGRFFPDGYFSGAAGFNDLFETMAAVQFNHRTGAYLLLAAIVWFFLAARNSRIEVHSRILLGAVVLQIALGVWTVLAATPLWLGLLHQGGALIVLSCGLYTAHGSMTSISMTKSGSASGSGSRGLTPPTTV